MKTVVVFSQSHLDFRISEFRALCQMFNVSVSTDHLNKEKHVHVLDFDNILDVKNILSRSILVKFAIELFTEANSYEELYDKIRNSDFLQKYDIMDNSYAIRFCSIGKKKLDSIERIIKFLEHVQFNKAPINLKSPKNEFYIVEEYDNPTDISPKTIYFGKLIDEGRSDLKTKYNLKERCYIGNTTMDPELSFIQANLAMIESNNIVLDPFVGTGGLLLPAAEFGAFVIGTEINYQTARAKGRSSRQGVGERGDDESILANFQQYGTDDKLMSIIIADSSKHGIWRQDPQFDAIIADPPYGVREKATKTVKTEKRKQENEEKEVDYVQYPEKQEYNLENAFCDLLDLGARCCAIGGRISFWYPVILENYSEENIPHHPAMELLSNCEQGLTRKTSRRLLTYRKVRCTQENESTAILKSGVSNFRKVLFTPTA